MSSKAILTLSSGEVFEGTLGGALGTAVGELVFNTSMSGYQEILTDASYCRQIVTLTYPHIGNVGTNEDDCESSRAWVEALVVRELSNIASNWRSQMTLDAYLKKQQIIAISDIDTRHLTQIIRDKGAVSACVTSELSVKDALAAAQSFAGLEGQDLASLVTTAKSYRCHPHKEAFHVVAYDFGMKRNILKLLVDAGLNVTVVPADTSVDDVRALSPDGVFLSNGPGDPFALDYAIQNVEQLLAEKIPMFGICLGFQLLALALGARSEKMKFGHHGANHPVIDCQSKKVFITSQNHGFRVDEQSLPKKVMITHRSLFDNSLQGIKTSHAFGFQGHPEASPGPHDVMNLFKQFSLMIREHDRRSVTC